MAFAALTWKNGETAQKVEQATQALDKQLTEARRNESELKRDIMGLQDKCQKAEQLVRHFHDQLETANQTIGLRLSELKEVKETAAVMAANEKVLNSRITQVAGSQKDVLTALARVHLELNASDEKLAEAKKAALEHQQHLQTIQDSVSGTMNEDNLPALFFTRFMMSEVAAQGQVAS